MKAISFEQDSKLIDLLLELLNQEQTNLVRMDVDAMEKLIDKKSEVLQALNLTCNARYDILKSLGLAGNEAGMTQWIANQSNKALSQAWQTFQNKVGQAKELNILNGTLINRHFSRNQQMINQLQRSYSNGGVYGANGQPTGQAYSRATLRV